MSSTRPISDKQQGQNNQQQANDPKRPGNKPVEPQKGQQDQQGKPVKQH